MFPHPNHLPRWLYRLLLLSGLLLLATGLLWDGLHFFAGAAAAELALPHPWEAPLMRLHGLGVLLFVLALGGLGPVHLPRGWRQGRNRPTGIGLLLLATLLAASGYALYYWVSEDSRTAVGLIHAGIGLLMTLVLAAHLLGRTPRRN